MRKHALVLLLLTPLMLPAQDPTADSPAPPAKQAQSLDALRRNIPLDEERKPRPWRAWDPTSSASARTDQPPTIPHASMATNDYSTAAFVAIRAPTRHLRTLVSISHFLDRDGQVWPGVPRRYFCTQCHLVRPTPRPLVPKRFRDVDE